MTYFETFLYEMLLAIAACALITNLVLLTRIRFGSSLITHMSLRPYLVSAVLLSLMIIEFIWLCFLKNITYQGRQQEFWEDFI